MPRLRARRPMREQYNCGVLAHAAMPTPAAADDEDEEINKYLLESLFEKVFSCRCNSLKLEP